MSGRAAPAFALIVVGRVLPGAGIQQFGTVPTSPDLARLRTTS